MTRIKNRPRVVVSRLFLLTGLLLLLSEERRLFSQGESRAEPLLLTTRQQASLKGSTSPRLLHALNDSSRGAVPSRGALRTEGQTREFTVRFVHSVWNLSAERLYGVDVGVGVPSSDAHQVVHSVEFTPEPSEYTTNGWEQKTARFALEKIDPHQRVDIDAVIRVTLKDIEWWVTHRDVGGFDEIPTRIRRHFLRNRAKYRLDDQALVQAARQVHVEEGDPLEQVRRIHDYVTDHVEYERDDSWDDAATVLRRGKGSCSEYAYLMIALCRLNGVPARYAGGSWLDEQTRVEKTGSPATNRSGGSSENGASQHVDRVFHRWVEVYLPRVGWFPIDPTQDDQRSEHGDHYRYFGRIPWSYLTMVHGDGDALESGILGWDYRSNTRWHTPRTLTSGRVCVDRYALWTEAISPSLTLPAQATASTVKVFFDANAGN